MVPLPTYVDVDTPFHTGIGSLDSVAEHKLPSNRLYASSTTIFGRLRGPRVGSGAESIAVRA